MCNEQTLCAAHTPALCEFPCHALSVCIDGQPRCPLHSDRPCNQCLADRYAVVTHAKPDSRLRVLPNELSEKLLAYLGQPRCTGKCTTRLRYRRTVQVGRAHHDETVEHVRDFDSVAEALRELSYLRRTAGMPRLEHCCDYEPDEQAALADSVAGAPLPLVQPTWSRCPLVQRYGQWSVAEAKFHMTRIERSCTPHRLFIRR